MPKCLCGSEAEYIVNVDTHAPYSTEVMERTICRPVCSTCKEALLLKYSEVDVSDLSGMYLYTQRFNS